MPLKYVSVCRWLTFPCISLITLAVQNTTLSIVMHYSRVTTPPHLSHSPAAAVLLCEILKGSMSFVIALGFMQLLFLWSAPFRQVCSEIFSPNCWKLSISAALYVMQNSLQFVAIINLPVVSFQVAYQMKILTTAAFSVVLLRKTLTSTKWLSLFFSAIGVGIVQVQMTASNSCTWEIRVGSAHDAASLHIISPLKGFGAVTSAYFTSSLAGVYFEMVLKNFKADLWVRNVQFLLFSLPPAFLPIRGWASTSPSSRPEPVSEPAPTPTPTPSPNSPDLQLHFYLNWHSNLRLTLTTSLLINYPSPLFMSLPTKLSVTGLVFMGEVAVVYEGSRG
ncbi:nucleotide-sugar transporter-domain-containing protein [Suillus variegatus]|nr:nucleotide-sugar transporter-domain-containing protein [Suillus variegatus]